MQEPHLRHSSSVEAAGIRREISGYFQTQFAIAGISPLLEPNDQGQSSNARKVVAIWLLPDTQVPRVLIGIASKSLNGREFHASAHGTTRRPGKQGVFHL